MQKLLFSIFLFSFITGFSQSEKIHFNYDVAGNQITRSLCLNCSAKNVAVKELASLKEADLIKFSENDTFSYYPNPVKEELFLNWSSLNNDLKIKSIQINSIDGRVINSTINLSTVTSQTISFQTYPSGIYIIVLNYENGEEKTIKIIKE